jgi:hypothetical protein
MFRIVTLAIMPLRALSVEKKYDRESLICYLRSQSRIQQEGNNPQELYLDIAFGSLR